MIDFADMLCMPYMLLGVHRTVLAEYQRQYKHILIDEFQDCNNLEIDIIRLIGNHSKTTVCGDDDQSIYSWVGISDKIFEEFKPFKVVLNQNYRSTVNIIEIIKNLIKHNRNKKETKKKKKFLRTK